MILFIKSIIIGICAILPGISGSVIAVSFGIYEKFIVIVTDHKKIKENKKFIIIVTVGILIGIYVTSYFLLIILQNNAILYFILLGIIISELPCLIKRIKLKTNKSVQIIPCIVSFLISIFLDLMNNNSVIESSPIKYFIGGILFSFGKVFPGVSSSFFLLLLGIYENIILIITNPFLLINNLYIYFPFFIGMLVGGIFFVKLLKYMVTNKYSLLYSIIIGLILSSVFIMIPKVSIFGLIIFFFSFIISFILKNRGE